MSTLNRFAYGNPAGGGETPFSAEEKPRLSYRAVGGEGVQRWEAVLRRVFKASPRNAGAIAAGWGVDDTIVVDGINYGSGWLVTGVDADLDQGTVAVEGTREGVTPLEIGRPKDLLVSWNGDRTVATVRNAPAGRSCTIAAGNARGFRFAYSPVVKSAADMNGGGLFATLKDCALWCGETLLGSVSVGSLFAVGQGWLEKVHAYPTKTVSWTPVRKWGDWYVVDPATGAKHRDCYETAGKAAVAEAVRGEYDPQVNRVLDSSGQTGICGYTFTLPGTTWQSGYEGGSASFESHVHTWKYACSAAALAAIREAEEQGPKWVKDGGAWKLTYFGETLWTSP